MRAKLHLTQPKIHRHVNIRTAGTNSLVISKNQLVTLKAAILISTFFNDELFCSILRVYKETWD